jgi:DNA polymerase-4
MFGISSAMPMFEALNHCPQAIVIPPNMRKYRMVGQQIRKLMLETTPIVESISIDEAFLDLKGTERLHRQVPAQTLVNLSKRIELDVGVSVSIGLSYNKFLAKIASDLQKPKGFSVIGKQDAQSFLVDKPVSILWGVGGALRKKLNADGLHTVGSIKKLGDKELVKRYGLIGGQLAEFAKGRDKRRVQTHSPRKGISAETTFLKDLREQKALQKELWLLSERISKRLKSTNLLSRVVKIKLKRKDFKVISRSKKLMFPTQSAEEIYCHAELLLDREIDGSFFRLIGLGVGELTTSRNTELDNTLDAKRNTKIRIEKLMDKVRFRFGDNAIRKGARFEAD